MAADLAVGKPLPWDVFDAGGKLLLRKGYVIATQSQLERLLAAGMYLGEDIKKSSSTLLAYELPPEKERPSALKAILDARERCAEIAARCKTADFDLAAKVAECAALVVKACDINRDVAIAAILMRQEGSYAIRHQVDVATIALLVARDMNLSVHEQSAIVSAALTMNLSMIDVQDKLDCVQGELVPALRKVLLEHPRKTAELLRAQGIEDELWLGIVLQHHEREDGHGYGGLSGAEICTGAKLLALADRYCARICQRSGRPSKTPSTAVREIYSDRGRYASADLTEQFVKTLGIYPSGSMVRLAGGEIGIVTKSLDRVANPIVHALLGLHGAPLTMPLPRDTGQSVHAIQETVDPRKVNMTVRMFNLWGKDASEIE
jgi:HD-GYP domain-containing protein (c-di-GMP phosphodiesterase class II)